MSPEFREAVLSHVGQNKINVEMFPNQKNTMKLTAILNLFIVGFVLMFGTTACKKKPADITHIPGSRVGPGPVGPGNIMDTERTAFPDDVSLPSADRRNIEGLPQNREMFAANTVYFDTDSSAVKSSEQSKLEAVANYFKSSPTGDLLIEGHCDERGTEGYNSALGDKRANSLREYIVNLGVSPARVHTLSLGESVPAATGADEGAYSKNRRGEFILVETK
jgi:peptidoglycan-associated lipoprotein